MGAGRMEDVDPYSSGPIDWEPERPRSRSLRRTLLTASATALVVAALGGPLGLLWHVLSPTIPVLDLGANGIVVNDPSPEEYIAAEGWFTLLGFVFGLVAAVAAWLVLRRRRGPALLLGVTIGALGAAFVAWRLGRVIGLGAYEHWRHTAATGATYHAPPDLHAHGVLLVPAFAAAIALTLLAGWSNDPDLDRPGARPGYGNDLPAPDDPGAYGISSDPGFSGIGSDSPGRPGSSGIGSDSRGRPGSSGISSDSPGEPGPTGAPGPPGPGTAARPLE